MDDGASPRTSKVLFIKAVILAAGLGNIEEWMEDGAT